MIKAVSKAFLVGGFGLLAGCHACQHQAASKAAPDRVSPAEVAVPTFNAEHLNRSPGEPAVGGRHQTPTPAARMQFHFVEAEKLRSAVVAGEPIRALADARRLREDNWTPQLKETWKPHIGAIQAAAGRFVSAENTRAAGRAVGELGAACAACHVQLGSPTVPPSGGVTAATEPMEQHAVAVERLWWGLFTPNDAAWTEGATALARAPTTRSDVVAVDDAARQITDLANQAATCAATNRPQVFGELLATCASCHRLAGVEAEGTR